MTSNPIQDKLIKELECELRKLREDFVLATQRAHEKHQVRLQELYEVQTDNE